MSYKDFDAFFKEVDENRSDIKLKLYGKEYELPKKLPAKMVLDMMSKQKKGNLNQAEQFELAISVFKREDVEEWTEKGLSVDELSELIKWAMTQYTGTNTSKKKGNQ